MSAPQFTPRRAGDPLPARDPKPRCHVADCERVVYKSVVCRKHWDALPFDLKMRRMRDAMVGAVSATADTDQEVLTLAEDLA